MNTKKLVAHIRKILLENPRVAEMVGNRVYTWHEDGIREKNMTDTLPEMTHIDGATDLLHNDLNIYRTLYQVSVWDTTQAGTRDGVEAVLSALGRYEGAMIERITLESVNHSYDVGSRAHGAHITFLIVWK